MDRPPLVDGHGRRVDYLRLSVTDRCNFRCAYCMPAEGLEPLPAGQFLSAEEIERLVRLLVEMGIKTARLTGGEPLLRRDFLSILERLAAIAGPLELTLTTNGFYLRERAAHLREFGIRRINVSLDSLDPSEFRRLTGVDAFQRVWEGIIAALAVGLKVRLNAVARRDMAEEDLLRVARLAVELPLEVRFIEFMPLCGSGWKKELVLPFAELKALIEREHALSPLPRGDEVAEPFEMDGGRGRIGFISSLTRPFCATCSRIRVTAVGRVRPCLFAPLEVDIRPALREGSDGALDAALRAAMAGKAVGHGFSFEETLARPLIRSVGG